MKTIALRFADNYAPPEEIIKLHEDLITKFGYVWYGKFVNLLSQENIDIDAIPEYYRNDRGRVKCWFKVTKFEKVDSKVMSKCFLSSNDPLLSNTSKYSISPYFVINYKESEENAS